MLPRSLYRNCLGGAWISKLNGGRAHFSSTHSKLQETAAPAARYFQDPELPETTAIVFETRHEFRKYNRAAVRRLDAEEKRSGGWGNGQKSVFISDFRTVAPGIVSCTLAPEAVAEGLGEWVNYLNGSPLTITSADSGLTYTGIAALRDINRAECELIIHDQDEPCSIRTTGGRRFALARSHPSLPAARMLDAVDAIAGAEDDYVEAIAGGRSYEASRRVLDPGLYFSVMARQSPVPESLLPARLVKKRRAAAKGAAAASMTTAAKTARLRGMPAMTDVQRAVVDKVFTQPLTLVQGPPGTGKSTVAGAVVSRFHRELAARRSDAKVLMMSPSNVASDNLARIASECGLVTVRVNAENRHQESREPVTPDVLHLCLEEIVVQRIVERASQFFSVPAFLQEVGVTDVAAFARECYRRRPADPGKRLAFLKLRQINESEVLSGAAVIVTTCSSSALLALQDFDFPLVVVDEATQGIEPEVLLAVARCPRHMVLLGDQCQLGPAMATSLSLFERLVLAGHRAEMLITQYRMHPALVAFSNRVLYGGKLRSGLAASDRRHLVERTGHFPWPRGGSSPMLFVSLDGAEEFTYRKSYRNALEAAWTCDAVTRMLRGGAAAVAPQSIGVITPYACQRGAIRALLRAKLDARIADAVEVSSVDGFQGREKEYIVISCVRSRSHTIGFVKDDRRLNVALTRAKRGLVIFGNPLALARYPLWNDLLYQFQENDSLMMGGTSLDDLAPYAGRFEFQNYVFDLNDVKRG